MVATLADETSNLLGTADVPGLALDVDRLRAVGRCVFDLTEIGWRYAGGIRWTPAHPDGEECWALSPDPLLDRPGMVWVGDADEHPVGLPEAGLCGAGEVTEHGLCPTHTGLPAADGSEDAWARVRSAVLARQRAAVYAEQGWAATKPSWVDFWARGPLQR